MAKRGPTFPGFPYRLKSNFAISNQFFAAFSRFEFALKEAGFAKKRRANDDSVQPDWSGYAKTVGGQFAKVNGRRFQDAVEFITNFPPNIQVVGAGGTLKWQAPARAPKDTDEDYVLRLVRTVRNNLFHGGKHSGGPSQWERDGELLGVSLVILEHCLEISPKVAQAFKE